MTLSETTPVIIGAGQSLDRIDSADYQHWSAPDLAAAAVRQALADAGLEAAALSHAGAIVAIRTFEDSGGEPDFCGKSSNFPRSVAERLGIQPEHACLAKVGGNTPQDMVSEYSQRIADGEFQMVLIAGAEAVSTVRNAHRQGLSLDFSEHPDGDMDDRGPGLAEFYDPLAESHGVSKPTLAYALAENARRARLGQSLPDYLQGMARLYVPFAKVAHSNPYSAWDVPLFSQQDLITQGAHNRWIADPFLIRFVSRIQVNQGAAVVLVSSRLAAALGVPAAQRVYLHGHAHVTEKLVLARPDLGASPASQAACWHALKHAGVALEDIAAFDFYSCFPIAVTNAAVDGLGLDEQDPRGLTLTGGLAFFGGPGNNYSLHAIAEAVARARHEPGAHVMVGANGGYLSKYSVGIYSNEPREWNPATDHALKQTLDTVPDVHTLPVYEGDATITTFTVEHNREGPRYAVIIGENDQGERVVARSAPDDNETATEAHENDALARRIRIRHDQGVNYFRFIE